MSMFNDPLTKALAGVAQNIMEKKVMCEACGKMHEEGSCGMTEGKMSELDMAGTELIKYAKKNGGIDKKDFFKAAELIQKGDLPKLVKFTNNLDTEPRDLIIMMVADAIGVKQAGKLFKVSIRASKMYETLDKAGLKEELEKDADDPCWKGYVQVGMKKGKDGKEVPNCVPMDEAFELPEDFQDEDVGDFVVAAAAAKKAGKKKFKFGGKEFPVTIKTDIKTEGFEGCKDCELTEEKVECPKCKGEGCEHCDGKGYHEKDLKEYGYVKSNYTVKHKTFSSAIQHAVEMAAKKGYEVDPDDYDAKVALGPKKPSKGKTNSYSLKLTKNGKEQRKALQVQIANLDNKFFELNMYIQ